MNPNLRILSAIAAATLLESRRTHFPLLMGLLTLSGLGLSLFASTLAITESATIGAMTLGGFLRLAAILAMALFVLTSQAREQQDKGMAQLLSLESPRAIYLFGKMVGYLWIHLAIVTLLTGLMLLFAAPLPALGWGISLLCEMTLISTLALLCQLSFHNVPIGFATVSAFYLLARSVTALRLVAGGPIMPDSATSVMLMSSILDGLAFLLPDLERFTRSAWLIQERAIEMTAQLPDALGFVLVQTLLYTALLAAAALLDLYRKSV
ncbi:MAG: ABC transporter permease [Magnetococcales bacterium]|nr:ABC transporter permease [Magnetococcales bacterium]